jgi:hypothetical protein
MAGTATMMELSGLVSKPRTTAMMRGEGVARVGRSATRIQSMPMTCVGGRATTE